MFGSIFLFGLHFLTNLFKILLNIARSTSILDYETFPSSFYNYIKRRDGLRGGFCYLAINIPFINSKFTRKTVFGNSNVHAFLNFEGRNGEAIIKWYWYWSTMTYLTWEMGPTVSKAKTWQLFTVYQLCAKYTSQLGASFIKRSAPKSLRQISFLRKREDEASASAQNLRTATYGIKPRIQHFLDAI